MEDIRVIIDDAAARGIYRKTVLSRSTDKSITLYGIALPQLARTDRGAVRISASGRKGGA